MNNISKYVMYVLIVIGAITFVMALTGTYEPILNIMYIFSGIALIAGVGAWLYTLVLKPQSIKQTLIGVGALLVVLIVSYALASDALTPDQVDKKITASESKWSGTGLFAFYILFFISIASIVVTGVMKLVKR